MMPAILQLDICHYRDRTVIQLLDIFDGSYHLYQIKVSLFSNVSLFVDYSPKEEELVGTTDKSVKHHSEVSREKSKAKINNRERNPGNHQSPNRRARSDTRSLGYYYIKIKYIENTFQSRQYPVERSVCNGLLHSYCRVFNTSASKQRKRSPKRRKSAK